MAAAAAAGRELMQQGSGRPAGGDVSLSKPASSKSSLGHCCRAPLLGARGWQNERAGRAAPPPPVHWGRTQRGGEEKRGDAGSWRNLTQTQISGRRDECAHQDAIGVSGRAAVLGSLLLPEAAQEPSEFFPSCECSESPALGFAFSEVPPGAQTRSPVEFQDRSRSLDTPAVPSKPSAWW